MKGAMDLQITKGDGSTEIYVPTEHFKEVGELNILHKKISPLRADCLEEMLSSKTTRVVWTPANKKWRCALVFSIVDGDNNDADEVAIFLPCAGLDKSVAAGTKGPVDPHDIVGAYQEAILAFKEKLAKNSKQATT